MRPAPDSQIDACADGLVHEYIHQPGGAPAAWQGPC